MWKVVYNVKGSVEMWKALYKMRKVEKMKGSV